MSLRGAGTLHAPFETAGRGSNRAPSRVNRTRQAVSSGASTFAASASGEDRSGAGGGRGGEAIGAPGGVGAAGAAGPPSSAGRSGGRGGPLEAAGAGASGVGARPDGGASGLAGGAGAGVSSAGRSGGVGGGTGTGSASAGPETRRQAATAAIRHAASGGHRFCPALARGRMAEGHMSDRPSHHRSSDRLSCAGGPLNIERLCPAGNDGGATPVVVLLSGADGIAPARAEAEALADLGLTVVLPDLLALTGHERAGFSEIGRHFERWSEGVAACLAHVDERAGPPALAGRSLGGALALAAATRAGRIRALVLRSAFVPAGVAAQADRLPPLLALHGERDAIVPPAGILALAERVRAGGGQAETHLYAGQAHRFDATAEADARARTAAFLSRCLGGP